MNLSKKKFAVIIGSLICFTVLVTFILTSSFYTINANNTATLSFSRSSVHMQIHLYHNGLLVSSQYHSGYVTQQGMNWTLAKWTGNGTLYNGNGANMTTYLWNASSISLGYNASGFTQANTVLPWEWTRVVGNQISGGAYNKVNWTATITPPAGGPYSWNLVGINLESNQASPAANATTLVAYDVCGPYTGIDSTYTITVNFGISTS